MTTYARKKCICNSKKPHFCPPCMGEQGFYACNVEDISSNVEELKKLLSNTESWAQSYLKQIDELKADCADMAADIIAEAAARHSDGEGGIHPALMGRYQRDVSIAHKYIKDKE